MIKGLLGYGWRLLRSGTPTLVETLAEAYNCAVLCAHAYDPAPSALGSVLRQETGREWTVDLISGPELASPWRTLVLRTPGHCFVVFRGTVPFRLRQSDQDRADAVFGWLENALGVLAAGDRHAQHSAAATGVLAAVEQVAVAARKRGDRVVLTGHSAGGAIAVHLSSALMRRLTWTDQVITFGAPMCGGNDIALRTPAPVIRRFEHGRDPVPWIPGRYAYILAPGVEFAADAYGTLTGRWPALAWQHVGELWYLHPPASDVPATRLAAPTGYGLSVGESRELIRAREAERQRRPAAAAKDHAMTEYVNALGHLLVDTGLAVPD